MPNKIKVGMADCQVAKDKDSLITYGLGSCVGLGLWDRYSKIAIMAHIMLPDSSKQPHKREFNSAKFADTAIRSMMAKCKYLGIAKENLEAKLVGGANMFAAINKLDHININIGQRNVAATKENLMQIGIALKREDTGGTSGRTVEFYAENGIMRIRTALSGEREL